MGRKGFSGTSLVMVAVLIFALFMVGKMVNPPPPGPPEPPKSSAHPGTEASPVPKTNPADQKAQIQKRVDEMKRQMMAQHGGKALAQKNSAASNVKKFDPNTIDVTPSYFGQNDDGQAGSDKMFEKVAKAKAEQEAERQRQAALKAAGGGTSSTPPPAQGAMPTHP